MTQTSSMLWLIALGTLLVSIILALLLYFDLQIPLLNFVDWLQSIGFWAPAIFILLNMLFVMFLLPSILLTLSAGFLFGTFMGGIVIVIATTLGATIAFLISRYLFSQSVKDYLHKHQKMKVVNEELVSVGWRVILLTRLVPFFPLKLSNYFFGASHFSLLDFVIGTAIGIIPNTFFIVYIGSLANDLSMLASGELMASRELWLFYALALIFMFIAVVYIARQSQRALARYEARTSKQKGNKYGV
jgi:uncharacterized membrane protein YdjX (TVP38/TMEM64 family)